MRVCVYAAGITHPTPADYLFSNNHVNDLITHKFDFSDEELLAYYISFIKTISLKLNKETIQFFCNAQKPRPRKGVVDDSNRVTRQDFPLYTEAIKFFNHEESMIRIAVRTITLNVYRGELFALPRGSLTSCCVPVEDESVRRFVLDQQRAPYFVNLVWFLRDQSLTVDDLVHQSRYCTACVCVWRADGRQSHQTD